MATTSSRHAGDAGRRAAQQPRARRRARRPASATSSGQRPRAPVAPVDGGAGQVGAALGDRDDPADAPARERAEQPAQPGRRPAPTQPAGQAEHRRRARPTGATSEVGGDRDQADLPEIAATTRRAGQLGGRGHRDRLRQPARQPAGQRVAPRRARAPGSRRWPAPTARSRPSPPGPGRAAAAPTTATPSAADAAVPAVAPEPEQRRPCPSPPPAARSARCGPAARSRRSRPRRRRQPATADAGTTGPAPAGTRRTRVRLVPETAVRCVRPVVRKSSVSSGGMAGVVAVDQRGHQRRLARRPVCHGVADRGPQRRGGAPALVPGARPPRGGPRGVAVAATSPSSTGARRPVNRTRSPSPTCSHEASPNTSTGCRRLTSTRTSTRSPNRPGPVEGRRQPVRRA